MAPTAKKTIIRFLPVLGRAVLHSGVSLTFKLPAHFVVLLRPNVSPPTLISSLRGIVIVAAPHRYRQKECFVPTQTGHTIRQCRSPNRSRPAWHVRSQRK